MQSITIGMFFFLLLYALGLGQLVPFGAGFMATPMVALLFLQCFFELNLFKGDRKSVV